MRGALSTAAILLTLVAAWGTIHARLLDVGEGIIQNRPTEERGDGYVSSNACKACHPREYDSWHHSYHRTMTQMATPDTVVANFNNVRVDAVRGLPMMLHRHGDEFWADFDDPDYLGPQGERRRITRQIVMMTGSHQQQVYWYATGVHRLISKLPAVYLIQPKQWVPRRAIFLHSPDEPPFSETGGWNAICIGCHTTDGKPEISTPFGSRPVFQQVFESKTAEFGIACEACHGPGERHIESNRNPARRYWLHLSRQADPTIVQPRRLTPQRSSEGCGQCHSVWEFYDLKGERQANSDGLPYRPGDELRDTRFIAQPTINMHSPTMSEILRTDPEFVRDSFWPDGMIRVSGREYNGLIDSPCYKNAQSESRTLSCFSCHALHKEPNDSRSVEEWADTKQLSPGMDGNEACLQCHPTFRTNLYAHTRHTAASGNLCYNCHMPYTTYGLLRGLRSHQISSPDVATTLATGRPNACNACHLDKTLKWTSDYLSAWYGKPKPHFTEEQETISASILWLLRGDAGQRALMAWSMGWQPAQEAAGKTWIAPILAQLLDDPYDAVRLIAARSLRGLPGFINFDYNAFASSRIRSGAVSSAMRLWRASASRRSDGELLLDPSGDIKLDLLQKILRERDNTRMSLRE